MNLSPWYFLTKFLAYSFWMWEGVGPLDRTPAGRIRLALLFGLARLAMGFSLGLLIWIAGSLVSSWFRRLIPDHHLLGDVVTYASVYVPVRWFEWAVFDLVIDSRARTVRGFFLGQTARNRAWRPGRIAISCLADIPVISDVGGLPVGRFMCRRVVSEEWIGLTHEPDSRVPGHRLRAPRPLPVRVGPSRRPLAGSRSLVCRAAPNRALRGQSHARAAAIRRDGRVCGPLFGGAFLAQLVAHVLAVEFSFTQREMPAEPGGLYQARYLLPPAIAVRLRGKRVAMIDV